MRHHKLLSNRLLQYVYTFRRFSSQQRNNVSNWTGKLKYSMSVINKRFLKLKPQAVFVI